MKLLKTPEGTYNVRFKTPTGTKTIATKATTVEEARKVVKEAKVEQLEIAAKAGRLQREVISHIVVGRKFTVAQAMEKWLDWMKRHRAERTAYCTLKSFERFANAAGCMTMPPSAITEKMIDKWINDPKSDLKLGTREVLLSHVRQFFEFCTHEGWIIGDPSRLVRINHDLMSHQQKETEIKESWTKDEVQRLLAATDGFWHVAVALGRHTGLRLSDIAMLEWACIGKDHIRVWMDKGDKPIDCPINAPVANALALIEYQDKKFCFPKERELARSVTKRSNLSIEFGRLCEKHGIEGKTFHSLRTTFARECLAKGIPVPKIKGLMGHVREETTQGYLKRKA